MIQERSVQGSLPVYPCPGGTDQAATAAPPSRPAGSTGCRWLTLAAELAGLAGGSGRPSLDPVTRRPGLPRVATCTPGADAGSVRAARGFTVAILQRWGVVERSEDIAIVVSELLTNALRHALPAVGDTRPQRPIQFGLLLAGPCVLCAVTDPSRAAPVPLTPGSLSETGRGLHIVCALSDTWDYATLSGTGKVVWAAFTHGHGADAAGAFGPSRHRHETRSTRPRPTAGRAERSSAGQIAWLVTGPPAVAACTAAPGQDVGELLRPADTVEGASESSGRRRP